MSNAPDRIGLIGIGLMGSAIADRLKTAGYTVSGFDPMPARREYLEQHGGKGLASAAEVARQCRRMFLCLPHSGVTAQVLEEIEPQLAPGALVIDTTTGEPGEMEAFGARLASRQVDYADATVAGSSGQVRKGEAIVMAGAEAHVYASCLPLLQAVAPRCFHVGPCGAGARIKLVVNLVLGLNRAVLAEGLAYAEACGVDPALALEVLKASPAYSRAMDVKGARMLTGDYEPEARLRQHHKDVRLILEQAREHGARVPFSRLHDLLLAEAEDRGLGDRDNAAIREVFRAAGRAV